MKSKMFFAVLAIFITTLTFGEGVVQFNRSTNQHAPVDVEAAARPIAAPALRQHSVLWDTTHGVYFDYSPLVRYTTLVTMLADSGYTVQAFGGGVHTIDLHIYDIIVICLGSAWNSVYTQEEVDSLVSFYNDGNQKVVLAGDINFCENDFFNNANNPIFADNVFDWLGSEGGLLIMGDNDGCPNMCINPILNAFYMSAGLSTIIPTDLYFSNFAAHPIFNNVSQVYYIAGGMISANAPAAVVAWTSNNEPVVAALDQTLGIDTTEGSAIRSPAAFPNPFTSYAKITGNAGAEMRIFDACGKLVGKTRDTRIGEKLKPGVYFVEINGGKPNKIVKIE